MKALLIVFVPRSTVCIEEKLAQCSSWKTAAVTALGSTARNATKTEK